MLDAHLARCPACRAFAHDVAAVTETLRSAPSEEPSLAFDVAAARRLRRRRGVGSLARASAAAAAIVAAFGAGVMAPDLRSSIEAAPVAPVILVEGGPVDEGESIRAEQTADQRFWLAKYGRPYGVLPT